MTRRLLFASSIIAPLAIPAAAYADVPENMAPTATAESKEEAGDEANAPEQNGEQASGASASSAKSKPSSEKKDDGFKLIPRWRFQYDVGKLSPPSKVSGIDTGWNDRLRRVYLGADAKFGGGFGARVEVDVAGDDPQFTDAYFTYDTKSLNLTLGQQKVFLSLDDMTSDLALTFSERPAFIQAFNYERRTGLTATYKRDALIVQGGVSTDALVGLNDVKDNSLGLDGRIIWAPKFDETQLHLAASLHWRDRNDWVALGQRYRSRPFLRTVDTRFVASPSMNVKSELSYGLEAAVVKGRFHAAAEGHWMRANRVGSTLDDPNYWGGYAEVGFFLTKDTRPYKGGVFSNVDPKTPLGGGGFGSLQVNARYDYLDLNSGGYKGGKQRAMLASLIWSPIKNVAFSGNYARLSYKDAVIAANDGDRNYSADAFLMRFQLFY